jgi:outer membrane protein assembly factor BamB
VSKRIAVPKRIALSRRITARMVVCCLLVSACSPSTPDTPAPSQPAAQSPAATTAAPQSVATTGPSAAPSKPAAEAVDWPTYLGSVARTSATAETTLTAAVIAGLTTRHKIPIGTLVTSSAAIVAGTAYVGSGDGFEYAVDLATGAIRWKTDLGTTTNQACFPQTLGVSSSATVLDGVVYVGGGGPYWYALAADDGHVLWRVPTGDNSPKGGHYNWSSPLILGKAAYIGIASDCDIPSIHGELLRVDLQSHKVTTTFHSVPAAGIAGGGGIWTTPAADTKANTIFVVDGEETVPGQPLTQSLLALNPATLAVRSSWQVPASQAVAAGDSDWSTTPTLFTDGTRDLVAAGNKNGTIYAFKRSDIAAGPVWKQAIAIPGQCGVCAQGTFSSMAFGGGRLFAAGGTTTIGGTTYRGSVRALDPATGQVTWEQGLPDPVLPALAYDNGFVVAPAYANLDIFDAADGHVLLSQPTNSGTFAAPSISGGNIVVGLLDGNLWVLGPP